MYSELVNEAVSRSGRRNRIDDIKSYANQSIRECQTLAYFARDMIEDTITADASPYVWDRPTDPRLRLLRTARYPSDIYPKYMPPGKRQLQSDYYYYAGANYFVFAGVVSGEEIDVAYYAYSRRFSYYDDTSGNERPAIYDRDTDSWTYWDGAAYASTLGTTALDEAAQVKVSNWLLLDWYDLVLEGTLAKVFKSIGDERAGSTFALFKSMQKDLLAGEVFESLGV